jgi:hypothetical protein
LEFPKGFSIFIGEVFLKIFSILKRCNNTLCFSIFKILSMVGSDSTIERLKIISHKLIDCTDPEVSTFIVQVNPEKMEYSYGIESVGSGDETDSAVGAGAPPSGFKGYSKMSLNFEFYADATGIVPVAEALEDQFSIDGTKTGKPSIRKHLNLLQNTVYGFNPEIHGPPYLEFVWGNIFPGTGNDDTEEKPAIFKGTLKECKIELLLFSLSGEPVKAKISLQIDSEIAPEARPLGNSPDITHHIDVGYGEKMTMHCNEIYGRYDSKICSAVAEYNNLIDWDLKQGAAMVFPSIHMLNEKYLDDYADVEVKHICEETEYEQMVDLIGEKKTKQYFKMFPCNDGSYEA